MELSVTQKRQLERNLKIFPWLEIDNTFFAMAVVIAFEMHVVGLTLGEVLLGEAIFALTILLVDIPTSVYADLVRRKSAIIFAESCLLVGVILLATAQSFTQIVVTQIVWAIGFATASGVDSAFTYETLLALGREHEHRTVLGKLQTFFYGAAAIGQIVSGFVGFYSLRLAVSLCIAIPIIKLILIAFLQEPPRGPHPHAHAPMRHLRSTLWWFMGKPLLILLVMASALLSLGSKMIFHTFNPYMEQVHIPILLWGFFMAGFNTLAAFIAPHSHAVIHRIGERWTYVLMFSVSTVTYVLMAIAFPPIIAALYFILFATISPFRRVFFKDIINRRTTNDRRATTLSIESFATQAVQMLGLPILGFIADTHGLSMLYLVLAGAVASVAIIVGLFLLPSLQTAHVKASQIDPS